MATSVTSQWWHTQTEVDWGKSYDSALGTMSDVFHADDRPDGFIEGTVHNQDAPSPGLAFDPGQGWS